VASQLWGKPVALNIARLFSVPRYFPTTSIATVIVFGGMHVELLQAW